jgi:hypothetical protein
MTVNSASPVVVNPAAKLGKVGVDLYVINPAVKDALTDLVADLREVDLGPVAAAPAFTLFVHMQTHELTCLCPPNTVAYPLGARPAGWLD